MAGRQRRSRQAAGFSQSSECSCGLAWSWSRSRSRLRSAEGFQEDYLPRRLLCAIIFVSSTAARSKKVRERCSCHKAAGKVTLELGSSMISRKEECQASHVKVRRLDHHHDGEASREIWDPALARRGGRGLDGAATRPSSPATTSLSYERSSSRVRTCLVTCEIGTRRQELRRLQFPGARKHLRTCCKQAWKHQLQLLRMILKDCFSIENAILRGLQDLGQGGVRPSPEYPETVPAIAADSFLRTCFPHRACAASPMSKLHHPPLW